MRSDLQLFLERAEHRRCRRCVRKDNGNGINHDHPRHKQAGEFEAPDGRQLLLVSGSHSVRIGQCAGLFNPADLMRPVLCCGLLALTARRHGSQAVAWASLR